MHGRRHHCFPLPLVSFATMGCVGRLWDAQPRTSGGIIPQQVTPGTLRASLGTFSSMPQFPSCSSTVKQLVILSCYSIAKNYAILMESPKLQRERLNIGTYVVEMRSDTSSDTRQRVGYSHGEGAVPSFNPVQCLPIFESVLISNKVSKLHSKCPQPELGPAGGNTATTVLQALSSSLSASSASLQGLRHRVQAHGRASALAQASPSKKSLSMTYSLALAKM